MGKRSKVGNKQGARKEFNKKKFGLFKGKKASGLNKNSTASTNPDRKIKEGSEGFYRTKDTIKRLNMYNEKPDMEARRIRPSKPVRIEPDRKWFGNTGFADDWPARKRTSVRPAIPGTAAQMPPPAVRCSNPARPGPARPGARQRSAAGTTI